MSAIRTFFLFITILFFAFSSQIYTKEKVTSDETKVEQEEIDSASIEEDDSNDKKTHNKEKKENSEEKWQELGLKQSEKETIEKEIDIQIKNKGQIINFSGKNWAEECTEYTIFYLDNKKDININNIAIKLDGNRINKKGYIDLYKFIIKNPKLLSFLELSNTSNNNDSIDAIEAVSLDNPKNLTILFQGIKGVWLRENGIDNAGLEKLVSFIKQIMKNRNVVSLQFIDLSNNSITNIETLEEIITLLPNVVFILDNNPLTQESLDIIINNKKNMRYFVLNK